MIEQQLQVTPVAGGGSAAFLGEVPVTQLISGDALATAIGLNAGTSQHANEPWLHFELDGKTLFVAKKPYRHTVSWDQLHAVNAVYGSKTVVINGETFKVRLLKGSASDPHVGGGNAFDTPGTYGSEWNRLFYPLIPNPFNKPVSGVSGEGIEFGSWAEHTETELVLVYDGGNGRYQWCQETAANDSANRVARGFSGVSYLNLIAASVASATYGWRPVLELIN